MIGPFPTVRSIVQERRAEMDSPEDVAPGLRRMNDEVERELAAWNDGQ